MNEINCSYETLQIGSRAREVTLLYDPISHHRVGISSCRMCAQVVRVGQPDPDSRLLGMPDVTSAFLQASDTSY